jgi:hypothetical protein
MLSARNLRHAKVVNSFGLNIYDLLYHDQLVLSRAAANELEELLGGRQNDGAPQRQGSEDGSEEAREQAGEDRTGSEQEAA